jgi:hypothetical protein
MIVEVMAIMSNIRQFEIGLDKQSYVKHFQEKLLMCDTVSTKTKRQYIL